MLGSTGKLTQRTGKHQVCQTYERVCTTFPRLGERCGISSQASVSPGGGVSSEGQPRPRSVFSKCQLSSWLHVQLPGPRPGGAEGGHRGTGPGTCISPHPTHSPSCRNDQRQIQRKVQKFREYLICFQVEKNFKKKTQGFQATSREKTICVYKLLKGEWSFSLEKMILEKQGPVTS